MSATVHTDGETITGAMSSLMELEGLRAEAENRHAVNKGASKAALEALGEAERAVKQANMELLQSGGLLRLLNSLITAAEAENQGLSWADRVDRDEAAEKAALEAKARAAEKAEATATATGEAAIADADGDAHAEGDKLNDDLWKTKLCSTHERGEKCPFGKKCAFAHGKGELQPPGWIMRDRRYKTKLCNNHKMCGECKHGTQCMFAHGEDELRPWHRPCAC